MFNADPKVLARLAPHLGRVLVFDPQPAAAKLAGELLKDMGARQVTCASKTLKGLELIGHVDPQLICVEFAGMDFDGVDLITRLRRSALGARKAPVIMIATVATLESIKGARDSGGARVPAQALHGARPVPPGGERLAEPAAVDRGADVRRPRPADASTRASSSAPRSAAPTAPPRPPRC